MVFHGGNHAFEMDLQSDFCFHKCLISLTDDLLAAG
jgi:hypothetical protein